MRDKILESSCIQRLFIWILSLQPTYLRLHFFHEKIFILKKYKKNFLEFYVSIPE